MEKYLINPNQKISHISKLNPTAAKRVFFHPVFTAPIAASSNIPGIMPCR